MHPLRRSVLPTALFLAACSGGAGLSTSTPDPGQSGAGAGDSDAGTSTSPPPPSGSSSGSTGGSRSSSGSLPPSGPSSSPDAGPVVPSPPSSGSITFHVLLGVSNGGAGETLTLDGDAYTDLIMSNFVAGAMYGHLIQGYTPGMQFNRDYLYGSIFAQLLQENLATEDYVASSGLIDSAADQQAVMGAGQGGPYQINNYAADMVFGSYAPQGYALINYVAIQKNIGYAFADAATQYTKPTPAAFNDKLFGPMLTAYFHFNDYVALQEVGPLGGFTPMWEPSYDHALATFRSLPQNFLDVLLNVAYNQGYYGPLVSSYSTLGATATASTLTTVNGYAAIWGVNDTYRQYPYQVRYYLDQIYDNPVPGASPTQTITPANHVRFGVAALGQTFAGVMSKLAYVSKDAGYVAISTAQGSAAYTAALSQLGVDASAALDLSEAADRAQIFDVLEKAIAALETSTGASFSARTTTAL